MQNVRWMRKQVFEWCSKHYCTRMSCIWNSGFQTLFQCMISPESSMCSLFARKWILIGVIVFQYMFTSTLYTVGAPGRSVFVECKRIQNKIVVIYLSIRFFCSPGTSWRLEHNAWVHVLGAVQRDNIHYRNVNKILMTKCRNYSLAHWFALYSIQLLFRRSVWIWLIITFGHVIRNSYYQPKFGSLYQYPAWWPFSFRIVPFNTFTLNVHRSQNE